MKTVAPKTDWPRVIRQMAADKKRLEAAIRGDKKALDASTFVRPFAV